MPDFITVAEIRQALSNVPDDHVVFFGTTENGESYFITLPEEVLNNLIGGALLRGLKTKETKPN